MPHKARSRASMRRSSALLAILLRAMTILIQFSKTLVARAFASCQALQAARKRRMTCWTRSAAACSALVPLILNRTRYPRPLVWSTIAAFLRRRRRRRRSARTRIRPPLCKHWIAKAARLRRRRRRARATRLRAWFDRTRRCIVLARTYLRLLFKIFRAFRHATTSLLTFWIKVAANRLLFSSTRFASSILAGICRCRVWMSVAALRRRRHSVSRRAL